MNSFESDLKRAFFSKGFLLALTVNTVILFTAGFESDLYRVSVPVLSSFPYASAWLADDQSGFIKFYLLRCSMTSYIMGKILACGLSGGAVGLAGAVLYQWIMHSSSIRLTPVFLAGMLWAMTAATLASLTNSRYMAYGGAFVVCYLLVIVQERYLKAWYCINPNEWLVMKHRWIFDENGIILLLTVFILIIIFIYYEIVRRRILYA